MCLNYFFDNKYIKNRFISIFFHLAIKILHFNQILFQNLKAPLIL